MFLFVVQQVKDGATQNEKNGATANPSSVSF
jgi:hypothetical protein